MLKLKLAQLMLIPLLGLAFFIQPTAANAWETRQGHNRPSQVVVVERGRDNFHSPRQFARARFVPVRYVAPRPQYYHYPTGVIQIVLNGASFLIR